MIPLAQGFGVSGVAVWAFRLAAALDRLSVPVAIVRHAEPAGHTPLEPQLPDRVRVFDARDLPPFERGELGPIVARYREIIESIGSRVIVAPSLLGDAFGVLAALTQSEPARIGLLGVQHSDIPYDTRVLAHYERIIGRFVAPSAAIEQRLRAALPGRASDIVRLPHGVAIPERYPQRTPIAGRTLRVLYAGRIENLTKRSGSLPLLADELVSRGVDHEIVLLGDGPAASEMDHACAARATIHRESPVPPEDVASWLAWADVLVLPSRYEGMSLSLIEAMANGCVPVVPRSISGVEDVIQHGRTGILLEIAPEDDDRVAAEAMAEAIAEVTAEVIAEVVGVPDLAAMSRAAYQHASETLDIGIMAERYAGLIGAIARESPRSWPIDRPCAFVGTQQSSGTVPADAADRLRRALIALGDRALLIHGAGQHTIELAALLAHARVAAVLDDDPSRQGETLFGWPILAPQAAADLEADAVLISSWINQQDIVRRHADRYRSLGLEVVTLYEP